MAERKNIKQIQGSGERWRIRDYLLQLSVVVIGILITFQGSAWIERTSQRRALTNTMSMVREELADNLAGLDYIKSTLESDFEAAANLLRHSYRPDEVPDQILADYFPVMLQTRNFRLPSNSFEVLKNSNQTQAIKNKELLRNLFDRYEDIGFVMSNVDTYYRKKGAGMEDLLTRTDSEMYEEGFRGNFKPYFTEYTKNVSTRNFLISTANGNYSYLITSIDDLMEGILSVIGQIDSEFKPGKDRRPLPVNQETDAIIDGE